MCKMFTQIEIDKNVFMVKLDISSVEIDETKMGFEISYQKRINNCAYRVCQKEN